MIQQGYFISAIGPEHILMAHNFAITLKVNQDPRPLCVLVKKEHVQFVRDLDLIEFVIEYDEREDYNVLTNHEKFCGMAKIDFHKKIPFDQYLMIDADFLTAGPTQHVWNMLEKQNQPVVNFGTIDAPFWHWNHLPEIEKKTNLKLSYTCGDIVYFNKNHPEFYEFIADVRDIFLNKYDEYGCRRMFGQKMSKTEEVAFAISAARKGYKPIEMHTFPIINYNPKIGQSYRQFMYPFEPIVDKNTLFPIIPPFVHLWDKYFGINYQRVFFEIITGMASQNQQVFQEINQKMK